MAERPVFVPTPNRDPLVKEVLVSLHWRGGFSVSQKQRNVAALHKSAAEVGYSPILEVSTKSSAKVGRHLSAFHLKVHRCGQETPLESVFQASKVFEHGGPFRDLYDAQPRVAKRDPRLRNSGKLVGFEFLDSHFPLEPVTGFYDWLYIGALYPHREWLTRLYRYAGFTDIEFNPARSVNCQARSCALFVALMLTGLLDEVVKSPQAFLAALRTHGYGTAPVGSVDQQHLLIDGPHTEAPRREAVQAARVRQSDRRHPSQRSK
ncbi:MAG: DUF6977 family protein [Gemmatimonadales bacterium]